MAKAIRAKEQATKAAGKPVGGMVAKVKDFGKNIGTRTKATGAAVKAASHVRRNRAAYIAGGLGAAVGAAGMAAASRKKQGQE